MANDDLDRRHLPIQVTAAAADTPLDTRDARRPPAITPLRPPNGAPNVLVILIDDMGFGASSAFGGPCEMPTAERMAAEGLQYTRFHTTALCSPTRQALLTGRNHHSVNMGAITEVATSIPGYTSIRPDSCATVAQTLRMNGYATGAFGKMHQTPTWETSPVGPFDRWPTGDGFEKFYGFLGGDCHQFNPPLFEGTTPIEPPRTVEEGYHLTEDLVDQVLSWTGSIQAFAPDKPWFTYLAFGATHAPHHAPAEWIEKYRGKFAHGHERQREITFGRQKEIGVIPEDAELTPEVDLLPAWDTLTDDDKMVSQRLVEAYAGMASHTDHHVGRLLDELDARGVLEDTLVFYILGDNGASAEAGAYGTFNEMAYQNNVLMSTADILPRLDEIGGPTAFNHVSSQWAHAFCTPYQWSKIVASHWGGTRNGMLVRWPNGIEASGELRHQFSHVIDLVPTILEAAGIPEPLAVNGVHQRPIEGTSLAYAFDDSAADERHVTQYFEIAGNRGIYHEGWTAVSQHFLPWPEPGQVVPAFADDRWELYGPDDWSQAHDLALEQPDVLRALQDRFLIEATKYNVLPLDDRQRERFDSRTAGRPDLLGGRTTMTLLPGMTRLTENCVPNIKNTSFSVTAHLVLPGEPVTGAVIAQGGSFGGWSLYFDDGIPAFGYNFVGLETTVVRAERGLGEGPQVLEVRFAYDGGGPGRGGVVTLLDGATEIGTGRLERTVPAVFSFDDAMDIGKDGGEPVVTYERPEGHFTGEIEKVVVDVDPNWEHDEELTLRARYGRQ